MLLNERFERRGAYYVPSGSVDWDSLGPSYTPGGRAAGASRRVGSGGRAPRADAGRDGQPPRDDLGRRAAQRPRPERRGARSARRARRSRGARRRGGERDARTRAGTSARSRSSSTSRRGSPARRRPTRSCAASAAASTPRWTSRTSALRSSIADTGALVPRAVAGWKLEELLARPRATVDQIEPLLDAEFEREGCFLLTHAAGPCAPRARRRRLSVPAERARAVGVEPALAPRAAARRRRRGSSASSGWTTRATGSSRRPTVSRLCGSSRTTPRRRSCPASISGSSASSPITIRSRASSTAARSCAARRGGRARDAVRAVGRSRHRRPRPVQGPQRPASGTLPETRRSSRSPASSAARCAGRTPRSASAATSSRCSSPRRRTTALAVVVDRIQDDARRARQTGNPALDGPHGELRLRVVPGGRRGRADALPPRRRGVVRGEARRRGPARRRRRRSFRSARPSPTIRACRK